MIEIRIHGRGGQGAVLASQVLSYAYFLEGYFSQSFPSFGAERRGAPVCAYVRAADYFINNRYEVLSPNYVIVLSSKLAEVDDVASGLKEGGIVFINSDNNKISERIGKVRVVASNVTAIALENRLGSTLMPIVNVPILGVFSKCVGAPSLDSLIKAILKFVPLNIDRNINAIKCAYEQAELLSV
jgi:2-oxoacid:acceptor oxidoreductase gamma subunit (pyruvate/2-ketoisovalerate family)